MLSFLKLILPAVLQRLLQKKSDDTVTPSPVPIPPVNPPSNTPSLISAIGLIVLAFVGCSCGTQTVDSALLIVLNALGLGALPWVQKLVAVVTAYLQTKSKDDDDSPPPPDPPAPSPAPVPPPSPNLADTAELDVNQLVSSGFMTADEVRDRENDEALDALFVPRKPPSGLVGVMTYVDPQSESRIPLAA